MIHRKYMKYVIYLMIISMVLSTLAMGIGFLF